MLRNMPIKVKIAILILAILFISFAIAEPMGALVLVILAVAVWAVITVLHYIIVRDLERDQHD